MIKKNNTLLYGGLGLLAVVLLSSFGKKPKPTAPINPANFGGIKPISSSPPRINNIMPIKSITPANPIKQIVGTGLDKNLILKVGSRGLEVVELQKRLGIVADGIFGPVTEKALFAKKGVQNSSLNQYAITADRNNKLLKVGDKVMASNLAGTEIYAAIKRPNNTYYTDFKREGVAFYNEPIGTIKSIGESNTAYSVFTFASIGQKVAFVKVLDVRKY